MIDYTKPVRHRGVAFEFGDFWLIVPAITFDKLGELVDVVTVASSPPNMAVDKTMTTEQWEKFREFQWQQQQARHKIVVTAIRRNYPQITDEDLADFIDESNLTSLFNAAMAYRSDLTPRVKDPGEIPPGGGATSTGQTSAPASRPT
jgi:hypothetical protein